MNLALASVGNTAFPVDRTQNNYGRELRGSQLLASTCARQKERYVDANVRGTTDDARARFVLCVTATSFSRGDQ